jgi:hypothetical protein
MEIPGFTNPIFTNNTGRRMAVMNYDGEFIKGQEVGAQASAAGDGVIVDTNHNGQFDEEDTYFKLSDRPLGLHTISVTVNNSGVLQPVTLLPFNFTIPPWLPLMGWTETHVARDIANAHRKSITVNTLNAGMQIVRRLTK